MVILERWLVNKVYRMKSRLYDELWCIYFDDLWNKIMKLWNKMILWLKDYLILAKQSPVALYQSHDSQEPCEPLVTSIWTETLYQADTGHQSVAATGNDFEGTAP